VGSVGNRTLIRAAESRIGNLRGTVLPGAASRTAYETQLRLEASQWGAPGKIERHQLQHLRKLVRAAAQETSFWRERLRPQQIDGCGTLRAALKRLPILSRDDLHDHGPELVATRLPHGQIRAGMQSSSGSTGLTVRVATTNLFLKWQKMLSLRCYLWAGFDFSRPMAVIRKQPPGIADYPGGLHKPRWDAAGGIPFPTGPSYLLNTHASVEEQWEWLTRVKPAYLFTTPSMARAFAQYLGREPGVSLSRMLTTGEVVDSDLRSLVTETLGTDIYDRYSSQEAGCMAIQCPEGEGYHVQSEAVIVEVLDDAGRPCRTGEIGRVVVTPLFNFATPLIRYELGDFAEVGGPCSCGRGLPLLNRIMGRRRNILVAADGRHYWPTLESFDFFRVAQSRAHQFRQIAPDVLEVWLVVESPRTPAQEDEMRKIVGASLPGQFDIRFRYLAEFPRTPNGKHEEFVSLVSAQATDDRRQRHKASAPR
jgi:phenylacetate-CoA ligase